MTTERLWAPWREAYIKNISRRARGCVFCRILKEKHDPKNYVVKRTEHSFLVLNIFPYNNGHLMVIPKRHVADLKNFTKEEKMDMLNLLQHTQSLLDAVLNPDGYNIGANIGKVAGAGFPGHFHIHVVPRWRGDVNFMPVTGHTKVISQSMRILYKRLCDEDKRRA